MEHTQKIIEPYPNFYPINTVENVRILLDLCIRVISEKEVFSKNSLLRLKEILEDKKIIAKIYDETFKLYLQYKNQILNGDSSFLEKGDQPFIIQISRKRVDITKYYILVEKEKDKLDFKSNIWMIFLCACRLRAPQSEVNKISFYYDKFSSLYDQISHEEKLNSVPGFKDSCDRYNKTMSTINNIASIAKKENIEIPITFMTFWMCYLLYPDERDKIIEDCPNYTEYKDLWNKLVSLSSKELVKIN